MTKRQNNPLQVKYLQEIISTFHVRFHASPHANSSFFSHICGTNNITNGIRCQVFFHEKNVKEFRAFSDIAHHSVRLFFYTREKAIYGGFRTHDIRNEKSCR